MRPPHRCAMTSGRLCECSDSTEAQLGVTPVASFACAHTRCAKPQVRCAGKQSVRGPKMNKSLRNTTRLALLALGFVSIGPDAVASNEFDVDASSNWLATTDPNLGDGWINGTFNASDGYPAWSPYPSGPAPSMWACGPDGSLCKNGAGIISGLNGPTEAFFALPVAIEPGM